MKPSENQQLALRCQALVKKYNDVTALNGLDLAVRVGECFGLLGPNGAGKTTTVEILEGLNQADSGTAELLGQRWGSHDERALRERIGVQLQQTKLPDKLTVEETIRLSAVLLARSHPRPRYRPRHAGRKNAMPASPSSPAASDNAWQLPAPW